MGLAFKHSLRRRWARGGDGAKELMWVGEKTFPKKKCSPGKKCVLTNGQWLGRSCYPNPNLMFMKVDDEGFRSV